MARRFFLIGICLTTLLVIASAQVGSDYHNNAFAGDVSCAHVRCKRSAQNSQVINIRCCGGRGGAVCKPGWIGFQNSCYLVVRQQMNYAKAKQNCRNHHSTLVTIKSAAEDRFVSSLSHGFGHFFWLGAEKHYTFWYWADGTRMRYSNWESGFPKRAHKVAAHQGHYYSHQWDSYASGAKRHWESICKYSHL